MTTNADKHTPAILRAVSNEGFVSYYTGRAGSFWVSSDIKEAFTGYSLEGARRKAAKFNEGTSLHGLRFVAVSQ